MSGNSDFILIGRVRRAHGVGGEVCVEPISDIAERFEKMDRVLLEAGDEIREVDVESVRRKDRMLLMKIGGIDDREAADSIRGAALGVRRKDVFAIPDGTYYVFDVIGCRVMGESGRDIGTVENVLRMPANDVYVLRTGKGEVLIPAVKSVVKSVDLESKTILIEEIEGLLG